MLEQMKIVQDNEKIPERYHKKIVQDNGNTPKKHREKKIIQISWNIDFNDSQSGGNDQSLMNHEEDYSNALKNIPDWECALNVTMNAHFENTL
ncbi:hypothetical protein BLOT_010738 [Blomia tropicalis]|nr:hypothetical protein BLOT_010738 [Blomia tropicalis]